MREVDWHALELIASRAKSRKEMKDQGYVSTAKSSALHHVGYAVGFWFIPGLPASELLEYQPRNIKGQATSGLPRLTCADYATQVAIHRALGIGIVPPGGNWERQDTPPGLFDQQQLTQ